MNYPIFEALKAYAQKTHYSFHTPGHKNGHFLPPLTKEAFGKDFFTYDLTEITGLDNLLLPSGVIKESQSQLAHIHQAHFARYLLGGTTQGLLASLMAIAKNKEIFIPRHAHRSIYHGLILANAKPIYLQPTLDSTHHIPLGISPKTLEDAIKAHPTCKLMLMVHPTYHGITWENEALAKLAKKNSLTIIVDEAHGAHFSFSPLTPKSALEYDCDIVIKSYHKTLPCLTQGSVLACQNQALETQIDKTLRLIATTSPSYPIMASLELASVYMAEHGQDLLQKGYQTISQVFYPFSLQTLSIIEEASWQKEPFRLWIKSTTLDGEHLKEALEADHCMVEMADEGVLLLLPLNGFKESLDALKASLEKIDRMSVNLPKRTLAKPFYQTNLPKVAMRLEEAYFKDSHTIPILKAKGKIASGFIQAYPPGIPQVIPGEIISQDIINLWQESGNSPDILVDVVS